MYSRKLIAAAIACCFAAPVLAQDSELVRIREEIKEMKAAYEQRIKSLEQRVAEAEAQASKAVSSAGAAADAANKAREDANAAPATAANTNAAQTAAAMANSAQTTAASANTRPASESAFNPAVSLILQGTYARSSQDPNQYQITGFVPSGGEVEPPKRGFGLQETELAITANIDPYFRGAAVAALAPDGGVEVEEAYFQTLSLPSGFTLKGGRFFSALGYQNEQHQHAWDFQDAPLVYKAFLGGKLKQDGLQLNWVAPSELLIELGAELSAGDTFPGGDRNKNGIGSNTLFAHVGGDIGASTAWRVGASYLQAQPATRSYEDSDALGGAVTNVFSGRAKLWAVDGVLKWAPNGNATNRNFKLQGEYFRLKQNGTLSYDDTAQAAPQFGTPLSDYFNSDQSGWYAQAVWQFYRGWRAAYRYDALHSGTVDNGIVAAGLGPTAADFPVLAAYSPKRNALMFDWNPSEFSRLRLQFAADKSRLGVTDRQMLVQYIYSLGAHGAHKF